MPNPKLCKTKRQVLLRQQDHRCNLCKAYLSDTLDARHYEKLNCMVCPRCMLVVSALESLHDKGISLIEIVDFLKQTPQDQPVVKSERRLMVEAGKLRYDGHKIDPETRKWVDKLTGEPVVDLNRPYKGWDEAIALHPDWADAEERLNS